MSSLLVTVFGGTGYLGRHFVRTLVEKGHTVRVAVRHPDSSDLPNQQSADVRDPASVARAVAGASAVINAVACYRERGQNTFQSVHVEGARHVAREATRAGANSCILISGIGADTASASAYISARGAGEAAFRAACPNATIVRPSALFGPGDALLRTFDSIVRTSPVIPLFGSGRSRLQPVYVGDVALAVSKLASAAHRTIGVFELGGPDVLSYRELLIRIQAYRRVRRVYLPIPIPLWSATARALSVLPAPPLTVDQIALVKTDNIVHADVLTFADLGIAPRAIDDLLGVCLP